MRRGNAEIKSYQEQISAEQKRQEEDTQGKRDETHRQLDEVMAKLAAGEARIQAITVEGRDTQERLRSAEQQFETLKRDGEQLKANIVGIDEQLQRIAARERSKLAPFGSEMEQVLEEIRLARWHGAPPVGPLGSYVKVRDPRRWADVMRVQIGNMMSAFAITDSRDRGTLERILKAHRK